MNLFKEEVDRSLEATKEILWERHFSDYGRGVAMFRTEETTKLVLKGIPDRYLSPLACLDVFLSTLSTTIQVPV